MKSARAKKNQLALSSAGALDVERAREYLRETRDLDRIVEIRDAGRLKAQYHRLRQHGVDAENDARRLVVLADARIGGLLIEAKAADALDKGGRPKKGAKPEPKSAVKNRSTRDDRFSLETLGLSKDESSRCQKLAKLDAKGVLEKKMDELARREEAITPKAIFRDKPPPSEEADYASDEWYTPIEYIESARRVLGGAIDLDPASCAFANETVRATTFYTEEDDGLQKEWRGTTWMNPPFSRKISAFVLKFVESFEKKHIPSGIVLVNNCTDTDWCQMMLLRFDVCFTSGRIPFVSSKTKKATKGTRQGQAIFYAGKARGDFAAEFGQHGAVMRRSA